VSRNYHHKGNAMNKKRKNARKKHRKSIQRLKAKRKTLKAAAKKPVG
jgi:hypothetical protein